MRVLIIDDEPNIRRITAVALEGMGHETVDAENGAIALQQLAETDFDAVFLDLKLADQNGMDLLPKLLKARPGLGVIVFSGSASRAETLAARDAGAASFLAKPFTPEQMRLALAELPGGGPPEQARLTD